MNALSSTVELPAGVAVILLLVLVSLAGHFLLSLSRRGRTPADAARIRRILDEADADCPPLTGDLSATPMPAPRVTRYISEIDAQRAYWKNCFIAWVRRGD